MKFKILILLGTLVSLIFSAPMDGTKFMLKQPDGSRVPVLVYGDEFYASYESLDGYTLIRDSEGWICYAELNSDSSSFLPTSQYYTGEVSTSDRTKHLRLSLTETKSRIQKGRAMFAHPYKSEESNKDLPKLSKILEGYRQNNYGPRHSHRNETMGIPIDNKIDTIIGLTILIHFPDEPSNVSKEVVERYLNQESGFSTFGNNGSVREYLDDASNGKIQYINIVEEYTTRHPKGYYDSVIKETSTSKIQVHTQRIIHEALRGIDAAGFDFTKLSTEEREGNSTIIGLNFLYDGWPDQGWGKGLWPHKWNLYPQTFVADGIEADDYQITNIGAELTLGTFIHETGHLLLKYPDLYSYEKQGTARNGGIKDFCTMASVSDSKNPQMYNPYFRSQSGWMNLVDISLLDPSVTYRDSANDNSVYFYKSPSENESGDGNYDFYILENRLKKDRDKSLPAEGLGIWFVQEGGDNTEPSSRKKLLSIKQADGLLELESPNYKGDRRDYFYKGNNQKFSDWTAPAAHWGDGSYSGLVISNIGSIGENISFNISTPKDQTSLKKVSNNSHSLSVSMIGGNLRYNVPSESRVSLSIYNLKGQKIYTMQNNFQKGSYAIPKNKLSFAPGVYLVSLNIGGESIKQKINITQ